MPHTFCYPRCQSLEIEAKYIGTRTGAGTIVLIQTSPGNREPLRPRLDLIKHSPAGFDWAETGSGAAQLALALLAHASHNDQFALEHYQVFKHEIVARLPKNRWELTSRQVMQMLRFVVQGTQFEPTGLQPKPVRARKTAVIQAQMPAGMDYAGFTAQGSARNIGDAASRAIRNLLRDPRLRNRPIVSLAMELSIIIPGNQDDTESPELQV